MNQNMHGTFGFASYFFRHVASLAVFFAAVKYIAVKRVDKSHSLGVSFLSIDLAITAPKRATPYALSELN
ncbi:MAG: hypothetical protein ACLP7Q_23450 [Isosphaeraceae bacterium]